jgi:hypothetical protein
VNAAPPPEQVILHGFNPADWEGKKAPPRKSIVPDYIPDETVTLLYADEVFSGYDQPFPTDVFASPMSGGAQVQGVLACRLQYF